MSDSSFPDGTEVTFNCIASIMGEKTTWKIICEDGSWVGRSLNCGMFPILFQYEMNDYLIVWWGMWWRSWLRHCATSRKVAGSIPDGVIGILHWHNPSGHTMALGLTQPLAEMSTRNISWGVKVAGAYGWQPYHLQVLIILKSESLNLLEPSGSVQACNGTAFMTVKIRGSAPQIETVLHFWHSLFWDVMWHNIKSTGLTHCSYCNTLDSGLVGALYSTHPISV